MAIVLWSALPIAARAADCPVGVNVNSFQNFSADQQRATVEQLKRAGVRFVRTSLRPDDKNMTLAKTLQSAGIGLVLVPNLAFAPGAPLRPADAQRHIRSAQPLSAADVELSRTQFQTIFDQLDAHGVTLAGIELGNEINWVDFNGDFPLPGQGKSFTLEDLAHDPEAKRVAQGFLQYLKVLAALKDVRDHSRLNHGTPIITAGLATVGGGAWQQKLQLDGVSIPATYAFLRAHGLDQLVDGYGVHAYPQPLKAAGKGDPATLNLAALDEKAGATLVHDPRYYPQAKLITFGMTHSADGKESLLEPARFVAMLRNVDGFDYLDNAGYHVDGYGTHLYPSPNGAGAAAATLLRQDVAALGRSKPIWVTEFGFLDPARFPNAQGETLPRALGDVLAALDDLASRVPVGPLMFYSYNSGLTDARGRLSGLVDAGGGFVPAAAVLSARAMRRQEQPAPTK